MQKEEIVQLDPRETFIIQTHANLRYAAASKLSAEDNTKIQEVRQALHDLIHGGGDAARVALQLFVLEFDNATTPPFGDTFMTMEQVPWDEALKMWTEGYAEANKAP
jgi:exonuclease VII small subunit